MYFTRTPPRASIFIDDIYNGVTPTSIDLRVGNYSVKLTKARYEPYLKDLVTTEISQPNVIATLVLTG